MAINNNDFEKKVKHQINNSVNDLDDVILSKLKKSRKNALVHSNKMSYSYLSWGSGILTSAVIAVLVITIIPVSEQQALNSLTVEQIEFLVISNDDELELYNELEFYQWLDKTHG